jgi:hypothetical protein
LAGGFGVGTCRGGGGGVGTEETLVGLAVGLTWDAGPVGTGVGFNFGFDVGRVDEDFGLVNFHYKSLREIHTDGPPFFKIFLEDFGRPVPGFRFGTGLETLAAGCPLGTRTM